jgi:hypothetical protein
MKKSRGKKSRDTVPLKHQAGRLVPVPVVIQRLCDTGKKGIDRLNECRFYISYLSV